MHGEEAPTRRKLEVIALVAAGCPNKEIAARLGITCWAVEKHLRELFRRYGVPNRAALVHVASRRGHLPSDDAVGAGGVG